MVDAGYDISDFKEIYDKFGTMEDFVELTRRAKELGLKVLLDLVPNHTSDKHVWFQKSLTNDKQYRDYYIWRDGKKVDGEIEKPPNNWLSVFGGPGWTYHNDSEQWYFHQFAPEQPDLNYTNPNVVKEMRDVVEFWLDKGVDGFRVDAVPHIFESNHFEDEPLSNIPGVTENEYDYLEHIYTKDDIRTYHLIQSFRNFLDEYANSTDTDEKIMMTEAYTSLNNTISFYDYGSHVPFNFKFIRDVDRNSGPDRFKLTIDTWLNSLSEDNIANWVMGNHDNSRTATRYPGRADQMTMLAMILPGVAVTYNGEEIGMLDNFNISFAQSDDPQGCNLGEDHYLEKSRDPARTPFQWDDTVNGGFNTGNETWLPVHENYVSLNLANQKTSTVSHYKIYQALTSLKKNSPVLEQGSTKTIVLNNNKVLAVIRDHREEQVMLLINFDDSVEQIVDLSEQIANNNTLLSVAVASSDSAVEAGITLDPTAVGLPAKASLVLVSKLNSTPEQDNTTSTTEEPSGPTEGSSTSSAITIIPLNLLIFASILECTRQPR
ncbi:maltase 1 isoform X2 [Cephus cinctus]|nr:maltase 1 isoform X2 [Cephus cinctus]